MTTMDDKKKDISAGKKCGQREGGPTSGGRLLCPSKRPDTGDAVLECCGKRQGGKKDECGSRKGRKRGGSLSPQKGEGVIRQQAQYTKKGILDVEFMNIGGWPWPYNPLKKSPTKKEKNQKNYTRKKQN